MRCDRDLVKLYRGGALVKVHPRQPKGGRSTDPDDYPPERTAYARATEAVYVGDSLANDVEGALAAGVTPVWLDTETPTPCPTGHG